MHRVGSWRKATRLSDVVDPDLDTGSIHWRVLKLAGGDEVEPLAHQSADQLEAVFVIALVDVDGDTSGEFSDLGIAPTKTFVVVFVFFVVFIVNDRTKSN
jgi:hypothetical protein